LFGGGNQASTGIFPLSAAGGQNQLQTGNLTGSAFTFGNQSIYYFRFKFFD